jgi:hypothetical protein
MLNTSEYKWGIDIFEKNLENSRVFSGRKFLIEHIKTLLPLNPNVAEVGVAEGFFSEKINTILNPDKLYLIDIFSHNSHYYNTSTHYDFINNKFKNNSNIELIKNLSWDGLNSLENDSLDYIYIDADHSYESVKKDISVALKKIKLNGIIQFNDYTNYSIYEKKEYGVSKAVNELLETNNVNIVGLTLQIDGYPDIAVQIKIK